MSEPKYPECEFAAYTEDDESFGEESWHFRRTCLHCGEQWWALHCPCDGHQNPCPHCDIRPTPVTCREDGDAE